MNPQPSANSRGQDVIIDPGPTQEELAQQARDLEEARLREEDRLRREEELRQQELARQAKQQRQREIAALHSLALKAHNSGELADAIAYYQRALEKDPGNEQIMKNRDLAQKVLARRQQNETAFAKVQGYIDRFIRGTKSGWEDDPGPKHKPCEDTNFFGSCASRTLPSFGNPDGSESRAGSSRSGIDTEGGLLGVRKGAIPANVKGSPIGADEYSNDPQIVAINKDVNDKKIQKDQLDIEIQKKQIERNRSKDHVVMKTITEEIDILKEKKEAIVTEIVKKEEEKIQIVVVLRKKTKKTETE